MAKNGKRLKVAAKVGKLAAMRERHRREEGALVRSAMVDVGWMIVPAAASLGTATSTLQAIIYRHPELHAEWKEERVGRDVAAAEERIAAAEKDLERRKKGAPSDGSAKRLYKQQWRAAQRVA